jgi:hypothetical protein
MEGGILKKKEFFVRKVGYTRNDVPYAQRVNVLHEHLHWTAGRDLLSDIATEQKRTHANENKG